MSRNLAHAQHNEKLSIQLYEEKLFLDWANTAAFYSAMKYVSCKVLPGTYNGVHCDTVDEAMTALNCKNKHEATGAMVIATLPTISKDYRFLLDSSFTARYNNYQVHPEQAKLCQKKLRKIKALCDPSAEHNDDGN